MCQARAGCQVFGKNLVKISDQTLVNKTDVIPSLVELKF